MLSDKQKQYSFRHVIFWGDFFFEIRGPGPKCLGTFVSSDLGNFTRCVLSSTTPHLMADSDPRPSSSVSSSPRKNASFCMANHGNTSNLFLMKHLFLVGVGVNARFDDGTVSLLVACSEDASELASRKGKLASINVSAAVFAKGLCPGFAGHAEGSLEEHGKRDDGSAWLRLRLHGKLHVSRKGNMAVDTDAVTFEE